MVIEPAGAEAPPALPASASASVPGPVTGAATKQVICPRNAFQNKAGFGRSDELAACPLVPRIDSRRL